jgi:hypothetical protein
VERAVVQTPFEYRLVAENGEPLGDFSSAEATWEAGDLLPFRGAIFEIVSVDDAVCRVRKVL